MEFQIDKSLEIRDKELFLQYTKELKEVHVLKMKMENFYENKEVMNYR
ncbi:IDEAL domain-containing protein [Sporosarcina sp. FSL W7-1349]